MEIDASFSVPELHELFPITSLCGEGGGAVPASEVDTEFPRGCAS